MRGIFNVCLHAALSAPDSGGKAICGDCGQVVQVRLTRSLLERTFEQVRRDHGVFGRHSMKCVDTGEGWCCAPECTVLQLGDARALLKDGGS